MFVNVNNMTHGPREFVVSIDNETGQRFLYTVGGFESERAAFNAGDLSLRALQRMAQRGGFTQEDLSRTIDDCCACIDEAGNYVPPA
jgi:hypothetical protein